MHNIYSPDCFSSLFVHLYFWAFLKKKTNSICFYFYFKHCTSEQSHMKKSWIMFWMYVMCSVSGVVMFAQAEYKRLNPNVDYRKQSLLKKTDGEVRRVEVKGSKKTKQKKQSSQTSRLTLVCLIHRCTHTVSYIKIQCVLWVLWWLITVKCGVLDTSRPQWTPFGSVAEGEGPPALWKWQLKQELRFLWWIPQYTNVKATYVWYLYFNSQMLTLMLQQKEEEVKCNAG